MIKLKSVKLTNWLTHWPWPTISRVAFATKNFMKLNWKWLNESGPNSFDVSYLIPRNTQQIWQHQVQHLQSQRNGVRDPLRLREYVRLPLQRHLLLCRPLRHRPDVRRGHPRAWDLLRGRQVRFGYFESHLNFLLEVWRNPRYGLP